MGWRLRLLLSLAFCSPAAAKAPLSLDIAINEGTLRRLEFEPWEGPTALASAAERFVANAGLASGYGCAEDPGCIARELEAVMRRASGVLSPTDEFLDLLQRSLRGTLHTSRMRAAANKALGFSDAWPALALTMVPERELDVLRWMVRMAGRSQGGRVAGDEALASVLMLSSRAHAWSILNADRDFLSATLPATALTAAGGDGGGRGCGRDQHSGGGRLAWGREPVRRGRSSEVTRQAGCGYVVVVVGGGGGGGGGGHCGIFGIAAVDCGAVRLVPGPAAALVARGLVVVVESGQAQGGHVRRVASRNKTAPSPVSTHAKGMQYVRR